MFGDEIEIDLDNYKVPTLHLSNVEIRNMLYDYQALIYVEKDNYIVRLDQHFIDDEEGPSAVAYHFGNYKIDPNITITNCGIIDSSFS